MKNKNIQSGQMLLVVILIVTVLFTALSASRITTQETKIAKLEDDAKRAFAAAEAGLEAALQKQSGSVSIDTLVGSGLTGTATISTSQSTSFTTPLLQKDEQFTFYLTNYTPADPNDPNSQQQFGSPFSGKLKINQVQPGAQYCDENGGSHKFAVELSFINVSTGTVTLRKLIDPCSTPVVTGAVADKIDYGNSIDLASLQSDMLIMKILTTSTSFPGAKLAVINNDSPQTNWYPQGKTIVSSATTQTGVTKKIQLFQSYPQVPSEFMMTSF